MKRILVCILTGVIVIGTIAGSVYSVSAASDEIELVPIDGSTSGSTTEESSSATDSASTDSSSSATDSASTNSSTESKDSASTGSSSNIVTNNSEGNKSIVLEFNDEGVTNQRSTDTKEEATEEDDELDGSPILFEEKPEEEDGEPVEDLTLEEEKGTPIEDSDGIVTYSTSDSSSSEPNDQSNYVQIADVTYTKDQAVSIVQKAFDNARCITIVTDVYSVNFINNRRATGYIIKSGNHKVGVYNVGKFMYVDNMNVSNGKISHSMLAAKITNKLYNNASGILNVGNSIPTASTITSLDGQEKVTENGKTYDVLDVTMTVGNGKIFVDNGVFKKLVINGEKTLYLDRKFPIDLPYETSKGYMKKVNVAKESQMINEYKEALTSSDIASVLSSLGTSVTFNETSQNLSEADLISTITNSGLLGSDSSSTDSSADSNTLLGLLGLFGSLAGAQQSDAASAGSSEESSSALELSPIDSASSESTGSDTSSSESSTEASTEQTPTQPVQSVIDNYDPSTMTLAPGQEGYYTDESGSMHHYIGTTNGVIELNDVSNYQTTTGTNQSSNTSTQSNVADNSVSGEAVSTAINALGSSTDSSTSSTSTDSSTAATTTN